MKRTWSETEMTNLLESVESAFEAHLQKTEENVLAKSETASKEADEKKDEKKEDVEKCGDMEVKKAEDEKKEDEDDSGYDDKEKDELHKMYSSMKKGERKAHWSAMKKAMGEDDMKKSEDTEVQAAQETTAAPVVENEEIKLIKSELEAKNTEVEALKKSVSDLVEMMNKRFTPSVPKQKAVTELAVIRKSDEMPEQKQISRKEIDKILADKAKDPTLAKSDREAINKFYNGAGLEKIQHLLK